MWATKDFKRICEETGMVYFYQPLTFFSNKKSLFFPSLECKLIQDLFSQFRS